MNLCLLLLINLGLAINFPLEGTAKLIYGYDGNKDAAINTPVDNQTFGSDSWSYAKHNREDSLARALRFHSKDIVGKSLMDFGCNEGDMLFACQSLGARQLIGIDNNEWCINQAKARVIREHATHANFFVNDMENKAFLSTLPKVDTVFLLAILDTSSFANKTAVIAIVSRFAKQALYYEGHQTPTSHVQRMQEFFVATDFTRFEYLGRFDSRLLMRFGREKMKARDVPSNAITSDHPDHIIQQAEEIYWFSDSQRNPPFSAHCRLIQIVQR
jgi:hypothetical protein